MIYRNHALLQCFSSVCFHRTHFGVFNRKLVGWDKIKDKWFSSGREGNILLECGVLIIAIVNWKHQSFNLSCRLLITSHLLFELLLENYRKILQATSVLGRWLLAKDGHVWVLCACKAKQERTRARLVNNQLFFLGFPFAICVFERGIIEFEKQLWS
jgi:hypothetical protein